MSASTIIFYIISTFILVTGFLSVTTRKIFRAAIWLLLSLVGIASLYFWMNVEFIAAVQIIVYVGGIVVLIIFSIFLTNQSGSELPKALLKQKIFAALSVVFGFALTYLLIFNNQFISSSNSLDVSMKKIGNNMLDTQTSGYALPFEVVSILLLAAMIGSIVIAMKSKKTVNEKI